MKSFRMIVAAAVAVAAIVVPSAPAIGSHGIAGDIDGDGIADLVIGVPGEDVNGKNGAGAIHVIYGSDDGLTAAGDQFLHQDSNLVLEAADSGDGFGSAVAVGDFNNDAHADVAVGVPGEDIGTRSDSGIVHIFYGSDDGLSTITDEFFDGGAGPATTQAGEAFGSALVAGDFNDDGRADLAIGAPLDDVSGVADAGTVSVLYGSAQGGLSTAGADFWHQDIQGVKDHAESYENPDLAPQPELFGTALARRDFDRDGYSDLAIGVPGEIVGTVSEAGAVNVLYGSAGGLSTTGDELWHQDVDGVKDHAEKQGDEDDPEANFGDAFGSALAAGDFDGDGFGDLAVGVPNENIALFDEPPEFQGAVNVLYGSSSGLTAEGDDFWHQDSPGVKGSVEEESSKFGASLAAADFNGDGDSDLAIGVPGERIGTVWGAGAVHVLYGTSTGLSGSGDDFFGQSSAGVRGTSEDSDAFGSSLVARNFGRSRKADLAVGVPGEDHGDITDAGRVQVFYGTSGGLTADGDQEWHQDSAGIKGTAEEEDKFGTL